MLSDVSTFQNNIQQSHLPLMPASRICKGELNWLENFGLCLLVLGIQVTADISGKRTFTSTQIKVQQSSVKKK